MCLIVDRDIYESKPPRLMTAMRPQLITKVCRKLLVIRP